MNITVPWRKIPISMRCVVVLLLLIAGFFSWVAPTVGEARDRAYHHVVIFGDPHLPGRDLPAKERMLDTINSWADVDLVIAVGDICVDYGTDAEYRAAADFFARLGKPLAAIAGNHDYFYATPVEPGGPLAPGTKESREAKLAVFRKVFGLNEHFYVRSLGGYRLVFLSTDHDEWQLGLSERQLAWLKAELANDRGTPTIIASHGPLKGTLHNYRHWINTPNAIAQPHEEIHAILRDNPQVFMWVSGHTHTPPWEDSFASAINLYDGRVTNIHNKDMNRGTIWTNSLYLYPDRVEVRTFTHADNGWVLRLDRTIIPPVR
jgi:3',5'-cyclic AMP phosphodiesterase CpdA